MALTRRAADLFAESSAEAQDVDPWEASKFAENLPIGSSVTINHAREDTRQQQLIAGAKAPRLLSGAPAVWLR